MFKQPETKLEILVAGDPGNGKANFIKRFLEYFPATAEVRRKSATVHFLYRPDDALKIQLYDVKNVEYINPSSCDEIDVVLFYYASDDPKSFQSLEKWIGLMGVKGGKRMQETKKELCSILVADSSNVGSRRDVDDCLAVKAKKLKEDFGIKLFIQSSFKDDKSVSSALKIIMSEVYPPELMELSPPPSPPKSKEFDEKYLGNSPTKTSSYELLKWCSDDFYGMSLPNCGKTYSEEIPKLRFSFEKLVV